VETTAAEKRDPFADCETPQSSRMRQDDLRGGSGRGDQGNAGLAERQILIARSARGARTVGCEGDPAAGTEDADQGVVVLRAGLVTREGGGIPGAEEQDFTNEAWKPNREGRGRAPAFDPTSSARHVGKEEHLDRIRGESKGAAAEDLLGGGIDAYDLPGLGISFQPVLHASGKEILGRQEARAGHPLKFDPNGR
jgi:hypothetical protein